MTVETTGPITDPSTEPRVILSGSGGVQIEAQTIVNAIQRLTEEVN